MTIDKILFVSDNNHNYLSFWPSISKYYKTIFGLQPHLFFVGDIDFSNEDYLVDTYGDITIVKPIPDLPMIIQTLWGKFWFTQTEQETNWLIGDIDLYLLSKTYLQDCLSQVNQEDSYVHLNANGYKLGNWWQNTKTGIPGYWHLAKGKTFKKYLQLSDSFEKDCNFIFESKRYGILYNGLIRDENSAPQRVKDKKNYGFICCEEHLSTERLIPFKNEIFGFTYPNNLSRLETQYTKRGLSTPCNYDIFLDYHPQIPYIDFHAPRPYTCFGHQIEAILYDK